MSDVFGTLFKVTVFGESHSEAIGVVVDGIPAGTELDMEFILACMARRAPGAGVGSTNRKEADIPELLSGVYNGKATGTPLAAIIRNTDTRSSDYEKTVALMRPGHADYTGRIKYKGSNDIRGGGYFSGRLTALLVFAGAIARQCLRARGIHIGARIVSIAGVVDTANVIPSKEMLAEWEQKELPVADDKAGEKMKGAITQAAAEKDSVGGVIECSAIGLPVGLGEPFFDSAESMLSHILFAVPAVKGVEFGAGFALAQMKGSQANDEPYVEGGSITLQTNYNGGINGGLTNGMPLTFRVAVKPTPSIGKKQNTVNMDTLEAAGLEIIGRHDACIVPRAVEVVKSAAAIALMDLYLINEARK